MRREGHSGAPSTYILLSFITLTSLFDFAMVKNRRSIYARKAIKGLLSEQPYTAQQLVNAVRQRFKYSKSSREIASICATDPEIQSMYPDPTRTRWGLRSSILEKWGNSDYFEDRECDYLRAKAQSEDLNPDRKSEFEFFKSLRDIINEEE